LKHPCSEHWRFPALLQRLAVGDAVLDDSESLAALCPADGSSLAVTLLLSLSVLEDMDEQRRYDAHMALDAMIAQTECSSESTERAMQVLLPCLRDSKAANRRLAVRILEDLAPQADARATALPRDALQDTEPPVVCAALEVLAVRAHPDDPGVAEAVIACLANSPARHGEDVTFSAVRTLGSLAQQGDKRCMEAMCATMANGNSYLRLLLLDIVSVTAAPGDEVALPAVQARLEDRDGNIRQKALETFAKLAPEGGEGAIAAVIACLEDESPRMRVVALVSLGKLAPHGVSEAAVAAVCGAVADEDVDVRCTAIESLPKVAAKGDAKAMAAVQSRLEPEQDADPDVVEAAVDALSELEASRLD